MLTPISVVGWFTEHTLQRQHTMGTTPGEVCRNLRSAACR